MKGLYIEPTKITPEINFSPDDNIFAIRGYSSPEDVRALYYPVIEWLEIFIQDIIDGEYNFSPSNPMRFEFYLPYFNSSSAKFIFDILIDLRKLEERGIPVVVVWHYDIDDLEQREAGEEMSELAGINFNYVAVNHGE